MPKPDMPPLLAAFAGQPPPRPRWFCDALAVAGESGSVVVDGAAIDYAAWGQRGAPGLILLHGGMAHLGWWRHIAPFFARDHRVVALSLSGMGGSAWRAAYSTDQYAQELVAAGTAGGAFSGARNPVVLAHSFGTLPTMRLAATRGDTLGGVILLDGPITTPAAAEAKRAQGPKDRKPPRETLVYENTATALARFRLQPQQATDHPYIVDMIARESLRPVKSPTGSDGVTWRFDPFMWSRLKRGNPNADLAAMTTRACVMWGAQSPLFPADVVEYARATAPKGTQFVDIPGAQHHVMVDQPFPLVAAVRAVLEGWSSGPGHVLVPAPSTPFGGR